MTEARFREAAQAAIIKEMNGYLIGRGVSARERVEREMRRSTGSEELTVEEDPEDPRSLLVRYPLTRVIITLQVK